MIIELPRHCWRITNPPPRWAVIIGVAAVLAVALVVWAYETTIPV